MGNAFGNAWDKTYTWYATSPLYLPLVENKIENWLEQHEHDLEHTALSGAETANALATGEAPLLPSAGAAVSVIAQHPVGFVQGVTAATTYSSSLQEAINLSNQDLNNQPLNPQQTLQTYNQTQNVLSK